MNQEQLLRATLNGEALPAFIRQHRLDHRQADAVALYATAPHMTSKIHVDNGRLLFIHGDCPTEVAVSATNSLRGQPSVVVGVGGYELRVTRSPYAAMFSIHVLTKVAPL